MIRQFKKKFQQGNITALDITLFFRQLATLISAGIALTHCLEILEKNQDKKALSLLLHAMKTKLMYGKSFFQCLRYYPHYFDALTCQLVRIGEHTGKLDLILMNVSNNREKKLALKKKILQSLFYPCIIMLLTLIMSFCMFVFVIPRFALLFQDKEESLPVITKLIFHFSFLLNKNMLPLLFLIIILICIFYYRLQWMKHCLKKIIIKLPCIKNLVNKMVLTQFIRNLSITVSAGVTITEALKLSSENLTNSEFIRNMQNVRKKISTGLQLHQTLNMLTYFPPFVVQMIKIGEESGRFEYMLNTIADSLDADINQLISYLSQLLEPLIMLVLGVLIGGLIIALYLPIFKLGNTF